jgi:hypothetical protein
MKKAMLRELLAKRAGTNEVKEEVKATKKVAKKKKGDK